MKQIPPELEGEYIVRIVDMPEFMNGMVKYDDDDFANIYINAHLNEESRRKAADHELTHVVNDDIHNSDDIRTIEARADGLSSPLKSIPRLMRARDLLPPSKSIPQAATPPVQGKVAERSEVGRGRSPISNHQATVLLRAISDLDAWFFRDSTYDL